MNFKIVSEKELNDLANTNELLDSKGDYGLKCVVFEDDVIEASYFLDDNSFRSLKEQAKTSDIGIIAFLGNLTIKGDLSISDRIMCIFVKGDLTVDDLSSYTTEVYIGGNLKYKEISDSERLIKVNGERIELK